jgi:hypothetical protein
VHAWWVDACAKWMHGPTILWLAALGEASNSIAKLAKKSVEMAKLGLRWANFGKWGTKLILTSSPTLIIAYFLDWVNLGTLYVPLRYLLIGLLWGPLDLTNKEIDMLGHIPDIS